MCYICLSCGEEGKVRKDGCCPNCWTSVRNSTMKDGTKLWVPIADDAPPTQMLKFWFEVMTERLSKDKGFKVNFSIHPMRQKNQYSAEVAMAGNLLMIANWNMEIAKEALKRVVLNPYKKAPNTLAWVTADYNEQLMVVTAEYEQKTKGTSEDYTKQSVESMEDVWS